MGNERPPFGHPEITRAVTRDYMRQMNDLEGYSRALYAIPEVIDNSPQDPLQPLPWLLGEKVWPSTRELSTDGIFIKFGRVWKARTDVKLEDRQLSVSVEREHGLSDTYKVEIWPQDGVEDFRGSIYGEYELMPEGNEDIRRIIPINRDEITEGDIEVDEGLDEETLWIEEESGALKPLQVGTLGLVLKSIREKLEHVVSSLNS